MPDSPRYRVLEVLHQGADTILYRARREEDGRPVVLKVLRRDHASPRALGRLQHELEVARALDSPVVIKAYGIEPFRDQMTLVLEDFGGRSLDRLLDGDGPCARCARCRSSASSPSPSASPPRSPSSTDTTSSTRTSSPRTCSTTPTPAR